MNIPNLMPFQMEAFNGDHFIEEEFLKLKERFGLMNAVETGTCLGSTTMFLAQHFEKVFTVEISEEYRNIALSRFDGNRTIIRERITSVLGDSKIMVDGIIKVSQLDNDTMFFLDAHWGAHCPLAEELKSIAINKLTPVIAIHDFQVPGQPELQFDTWEGQPINFTWLKPLFDEIYGKDNYHYHYNTSKRATEIKRGIIYVYPKTVPERKEKPVVSTEAVTWPEKPAPAPQKNLPQVSLYINYYHDNNPERAAELAKTLKENYDNPGIDRIIAIVDHGDYDDLKRMENKVVVIKSDNRPTYRDFFDTINKRIESINEISVIANTDIVITPTVIVHVKMHMKKPLCFALSAWDKLADGSYQQMKKNFGQNNFVPKDDAQDAWVFKGKIRNIVDCDFTMGKPGCDNAIAERLQRAGYKVTNPSNDIRPVHHHLVEVRNYDTTDLSNKEYVNPDRVAKPYLILPPISLAQIPFVHDDLWPEYQQDHEEKSFPANNWIEEIHALRDVKGGESQFSEDAIIDHIFKHIGAPLRFFVDLGAGAYEGSTMSNTRTLKRKGWIGFGIDAKPTRDHWVLPGFIKPETIVETLASQKTPMFFDFLNLDIDSSDFWVLKKILEAGYRPRLICTEFNGTLMPDLSLVLKYERGYTWDGTNKYGYSFAAGKKLLERYGYEIIYNLHDTDIFAVRKEFIKGIDFYPVTAKSNMYHPVNPSAVWESY